MSLRMIVCLTINGVNNRKDLRYLSIGTSEIDCSGNWSLLWGGLGGILSVGSG